MPTPQSILFIIVSRIGDTLFATPSIRAIAQAFPHAKIDVLGHPKRFEILKNLPFVNSARSITKNTASWKNRFAFGSSYDIAFVYHYDEQLVAYALRVARKVVAFRQPNKALNEKLYRCVTPPPFQSEHAVRLLLRLPESIGIKTNNLRLAYQCTDTEREQALNRLIDVSTGDACPLIGLQVASFPTKGYRDWPIENFAQLAKNIIDIRSNAHFLIFGGSNEKARTNWLKSQLGDKATLFAGQLSLRETAALMSWLHIYVGIDTGPTHIMSTYDIPMVALYHCLSSSAHTGPIDHPMAYLIDHPKTDTDSCTETTQMGEITVNQVMYQVEKALTEHPPENR